MQANLQSRLGSFLSDEAGDEGEEAGAAQARRALETLKAYVASTNASAKLLRHVDALQAQLAGMHPHALAPTTP